MTEQLTWSSFPFCFILLYFIQTSSHYLAQIGLKFTVLLPQLPKYCHHRPMPPSSALSDFLRFISFSRMDGGDSGLKYIPQEPLFLSPSIFFYILQVSPQQFRYHILTKLLPEPERRYQRNFHIPKSLSYKVKKKNSQKPLRKCLFLPVAKEGHGTTCSHYGRMTRKAIFWHLPSQPRVGLLGKEGRDDGQPLTAGWSWGENVGERRKSIMEESHHTGSRQHSHEGQEE